MNRSKLKVLVVLATAVTALVVSASPASATIWLKDTGDPPPYYIWDDPGGICRYTADGSKLLKIRIRPPEALYGKYQEATRVGWQYRIAHIPDVTQNPFFYDYEFVFHSRRFKDVASAATPADWDGRWRTWVAPKTIAPGGYQVFFTITWYKPGTSHVIDEKVWLAYQFYAAKMGTESQLNWQWCNAVYSPSVSWE
jgi:hypothetical protein